MKKAFVVGEKSPRKPFSEVLLSVLVKAGPGVRYRMETRPRDRECVCKNPGVAGAGKT